MSEYVYGIDLGTTFSACAQITPGDTDSEPEAMIVDRNENDSFETIPSIVYLHQRVNGSFEAVVGRRARRRVIDGQADEELIEFAKRFIGLQPPSGKSWWVNRSEEFDPIDISALVLRKIHSQIEEAEGKASVIRAVVSHPRDFTVPRKEATAMAARLAGFQLIETVNEPEAAAAMYLGPDMDRNPGKYMVFDLGGGTLDIAVLEVPPEGRAKVLGGHGLSKLGGKDWDEKMMEVILEAAQTHHNQDHFDFRREASLETIERLRELARDWKERAGKRRQFKIKMNTTLKSGAATRTKLLVQREDWERRCEPLVERCRAAIDRALERCNPSVSDAEITTVFPVGGSTRLASIQRMLKERFGDRLADPADYGVSVDLAVAQGAARMAAYLSARPDERSKQHNVPDETELEADDAEESPPRSSLAHGLNVLVSRNGKPWLQEVVAEGEALPCSCSRLLRVKEPGALIVLKVYEGSPGPVLAGVQPSARIAFPPAVVSKRGDRIEVTIEVSSSGRITVRARHVDSNQELKHTIRLIGIERPDDDAPDDAPDDDTTTPSRRARLEAIEVI